MKNFKKIMVITILLFFNITIIFAQTIPNGNFEEWDSSGNPSSWQTSNQFGEQYGFTPVTRTTDKYSGNFAIKLETVSTTVGPNIPGVVCLGNLGYYTVDSGVSFPFKPIKLKGYFKHPTFGDTIEIITILLKQDKDSTRQIGSGKFTTIDSNNSYKYFEAEIDYSTTETPDLLDIVLLTSDSVGSALIIDDLEFEFESNGIIDGKSICSLTPIVYPDPVNDIINFVFNDESQKSVKVFDSNLREIASICGCQRIMNIDLSFCSQGVYFYSISSGSFKEINKFLIIR